MKTVIVRGRTPLPEALRDVIQRGSTSVHEWRVPGPTPLATDADRIVYFVAGQDAAAVASATQALTLERRQGSEKLVYVMGDDAEPLDGLAPSECFRWPADEDRLKMAFMTSA